TLYQSRILEHNRSPHNRFRLDHATHRARGLDALCGDDLWIWLELRHGIIERASWTGEACVITTASASMLTDWMTGKTLAEVVAGDRRFRDLLRDPALADDDQLGELNGLRPVHAFPSRVRNALLPWTTTLQAIRQGSNE
ncbi:MAG: Fe-S cluster assembly sulfur transfer protein SufU, partial [Wenzhouxiangellaceae bacterium]